MRGTERRRGSNRAGDVKLPQLLGDATAPASRRDDTEPQLPSVQAAVAAAAAAVVGVGERPKAWS